MRIRLAIVGVVASAITLAAALDGADMAPAAPTAGPASVCAYAADTFFNECAALDTTQVQDRRPTTAPVTPTTAPIAVCQEEDGSTPGQAFPCRWDGTAQGNGQGDSYTLDGPAA